VVSFVENDITGKTVEQTFTLTVVPGGAGKEDVSDLIVFENDTVTWKDANTWLRIKPATFSGTGLADTITYQYAYYTSRALAEAGGTANIASIAGTGGKSLTGRLDVTASELDHDQDSVGIRISNLTNTRYYVRVDIKSGTGNNGPYSGSVVRAVTVKGKVLSMDNVTVFYRDGGEVFTNQSITPRVVVRETDADGKDVDVTNSFTVSYGRNTESGVDSGSISIIGKPGSLFSVYDPIETKFDIAKAVLNPSVTIGSKTRYYDGTDSVTTGLADIVTLGGKYPQGSLGVNYEIISAKYTNGGEGGITSAAVVVRLKSGRYSNNHTFEGDASEITLVDESVGILAVNPTSLTGKATPFKFVIPTNIRYNGEEHPITVEFNDSAVVHNNTKVVKYGDDGNIEVLYSSAVPNSLFDGYKANSDTAVAPVKAGTYTVKARVKDGKNFTDEKVTLTSSYVIKTPVIPELTALPAKIDLLAGQIRDIAIVVKADTAATFTYQWSRISGVNFADTAKLEGETDKTLRLNTSTPRDTSRYFVEVKSSGLFQADTTVKSNEVLVIVGAEGLDIRDLDITLRVTDTVYNGRAKVVSASQVVAKTLAGATVAATNFDVTVDPTRNVDAGTAIVTLIGKGSYAYSTSRDFRIVKAPIANADLTFRSSNVYNGVPQGIAVTLPVVASPTASNPQKTGLGPVTAIEYRRVVAPGDTQTTSTAPTNVGSYTVSVKIGEGDNFLARDSAFYRLPGSYSITKASVTKASDFAGYALEPNARISIADAPVSIGTLSLPGTGYDILVRYGPARKDTIPPTAPGTYSVFAEVLSSSANYNVNPGIKLGEFTLYDPAGVASSDHVIPGGKDGQAVVAPISVVAGEFTVGPNPVAKVSGKVSFFWQGKALSSGTLYVYDVTGNLVTKVAVSDRGVSTERRAVAGWDLVDAKGRAVAEGTYLVKGALVGKDGGKVKVSSILGVSK